MPFSTSPQLLDTSHNPRCICWLCRLTRRGAAGIDMHCGAGHGAYKICRGRRHGINSTAAMRAPWCGCCSYCFPRMKYCRWTFDNISLRQHWSRTGGARWDHKNKWKDELWRQTKNKRCKTSWWKFRKGVGGQHKYVIFICSLLIALMIYAQIPCFTHIIKGSWFFIV